MMPPIYAKLPRAPRNGSPVPDLTSLYHKDAPGPWGDRKYPGNCSGELIKDLLRYFRPRRVYDPMTGSSTCAQVCADLGIPCVSTDLKKGADACDPATYPPGKFDFIWLHPPYFRQKVYSSDPRDLSTAPTLDAFLDRYRRLIDNCTRSLAPGGRLVILMGDYTDREYGFVPLVYHTKRLAFDCGLRQPCTDIVRFSHAASSSKKTYRSAFIPGLHDMCVVFEKPRLAAQDRSSSYPSTADQTLNGTTRPVPTAQSDAGNHLTTEDFMPKPKPTTDANAENPGPAGTPQAAPATPANAPATSPGEPPAHPAPHVLDTIDLGGPKMRLARSGRFHQLQISFEEKPPTEITERLHDAGWKWRSAEQVWTKQLDADARWRTQADAEALFRELADQIRATAAVPPAREAGR